jgi:hypothetical protein
MTLIGIVMNLTLAGLLLAALVVGIRLNRRLGALRDSHDGFEVAVRDLNLAAQRAEQGLADLRAATDEATDTLSDRIEKGRALAVQLERLISAAPELPKSVGSDRIAPTRSMPSAMPVRETAAEHRLATLLALARARIESQGANESETPIADDLPIRRQPQSTRQAVSLDDDLFEDAPVASSRFAGARR